MVLEQSRARGPGTGALPGPRAGAALPAGQLLVLDLAGLEFCDSSGISALLTARNLAIERDGTIALAAVPANTARILRIVGLDRVFSIYPDSAAATAGDAATRRSA
ncbi:STAS domain-containing protein [Streptomyces sp. NPDC055060]